MLFYEKKGQGPNVLLLHGLPCNRTIWYELVNQLANDFTFIIPDLPGAGESTEWQMSFSLMGIAVELNNILEKEGIHKTIIAGHSMGGYTSMAFLKSFPEKVKAVSLIHSTSQGDTEDKKLNRNKSIAFINKGNDAKKAYVKAMIKGLFDETFAALYPDVIQSSIAMGNLLSAQTLIHFFEALRDREDTTELSSTTSIPMQWILGAHDTATPLNDALSRATASQSIRNICIYPNCGHMSMLELPRRLKKDLKMFWGYCSTL